MIKEFVFKGNMVDMAIGIIMGGAFGLAVKSLVDNVVMPLAGHFTGGIDFADKFASLGTETKFTTLAAAEEARASPSSITGSLSTTSSTCSSSGSRCSSW